MNKLLMVLIFLIGFAEYGKARSTDLARIEYTYFPQTDSDNSFRRFRTFVNFPIAVGREGSYLVPGIEYENINFKYEDRTPFEKGNEIDRFQSTKDVSQFRQNCREHIDDDCARGSRI